MQLHNKTIDLIKQTNAKEKTNKLIAEEAQVTDKENDANVYRSQINNSNDKN